jgi:GNAT superfamily N-acetyltransferase
MPLEILPATVDDVPAIFDMILGLAEYEKLAHQVTGTEAQLRASLFGPVPAAEVLIARHDSRYAGFALFFPSYSTFLTSAGMYLEDLFVYPEFRGQGIGFALLCRLAAISVERGYGRIEWNVLDWNQPSIQFYRQLGAHPLDEWTKYRLTGPALENLAGRNHHAEAQA